MPATNNLGGKLRRWPKTKIIATLGPAVDSYEKVSALIEAGVNGVRLNFAYGTDEHRAKQIAWVRRAAKAATLQVAIIQDLPGPKLHLGDFDDLLAVSPGKHYSFSYQADYAADGHVPLAFDAARHARRGHRLLTNDGRLRFMITAVKDGVIFARAENEGVLVRRKGINLPDSDFSADILTAKDRQSVAFGLEHGVDHVALSFVHGPADIHKLRRLLNNLGSRAKIIAKIETQSAVNQMEGIIDEADLVMVARGDLASETMPEQVPVLQKKIVELALRHGKPSIVATQLLAGMVDRPDPSRAEIADIAAAVMMGADAVLLADETAVGKHPLESVAMLERVVGYTERHLDVNKPPPAPHLNRQAAVCRVVVELSARLAASAIVAETKSGATAVQLSCERPRLPILAVTASHQVARQLAVVYGVKSYVRPIDKYTGQGLTDWLARQRILKKGDTVVSCQGRYPGVMGATDTIKARVV